MNKEWLKSIYAQVAIVLKAVTTGLTTVMSVLRTSILLGWKKTKKNITSKLSRRKRPRKDGGHYLGISVSWLNTYEENREILLEQYRRSVRYSNSRTGRDVRICKWCETETLVSLNDSRYRCYSCNYWENK